MTVSNFYKSLALTAFVLAKATAAGGAEFATLARYLPSDANAIIVVNAAAIYDSPIGKREDWRQRSAEAFETTPLLLPPSAQHCVMAANLNIETLRPEWEAASMTLSIDPAIAEVATRHGGTTDSLVSFGAAWLGRNTCVVKFAPRTFALLTPTSRQNATRWVANVASSDVARLSHYLQQSLSYADSVGTEVILAVDLAGAISEADIRTGVAQSKLLKAVAEDQASAVLSSIQGVKLGVRVGEGLKGKLQLDFAEDATLFAPVAKPLVIGILSKAGAMLDEFNDWTAKAEGKSLSIEGELTPAGMQRLFSLLAIDSAALERDDAGSPPVKRPATDKAPISSSADQKKAAMAKASQRYFRSVGKYVADAQKLSRADSLQQAVLWIENYARRVEALPTRNVDPDLVHYGNYVAQTFRWAVDQSSDVAAKVDAQAQAEQGNVEYRFGYLPTGRTVNYGGNFQRMYAPYGFAQYNPDPQAAEKRQKTQDEVYKSVEDARQALTKLAADQESVRQKLNERYGGGF